MKKFLTFNMLLFICIWRWFSACTLNNKIHTSFLTEIHFRRLESAYALGNDHKYTLLHKPDGFQEQLYGFSQCNLPPQKKYFLILSAGIDIYWDLLYLLYICQAQRKMENMFDPDDMLRQQISEVYMLGFLIWFLKIRTLPPLRKNRSLVF